MAEFKNDKKAKRYYWLQLKTDFFDQKEIKLLRKIAGGDTYTVIYLKMLLASLKDEGRLYFEAIGDNFAEEIALMIDEDTENVEITLKFLESKQLIEVIEDDEYYLNRVPEMLGSESYSAERMRNLRAREKRKVLQSDTLTSQSDSGVTKRRDREDIEIEKSNNIDQSSSKEADKVSLKNRFELIWKEYPKKQGKEAAFKSYQKAAKEGITDETILNGINAYKKQIELQRTELQFIKQGSTFFNQRSYLDEFITSNSKLTNSHQEQEIPPEWAEHIEKARKVPSYDESELPELPY